MRYEKTTPAKGTGGLDGKGRIAPAVSDKFLRAVEDQNEIFKDSAVVDQLVWRDCTEFSFKRGGLSRPVGLNLPWPNLVEQVGHAAARLQASVKDPDSDERELLQAVEQLSGFPMNVSLLQATSAGKIVRKSVKSLTKQNRNGNAKQRLEKLLQSYMALASDAGVQVDSSAKIPNNKQATGSKSRQVILQDLKEAESCQNWRQLFAVLKEREETRRSSQGKRMREIRKNLASGRPKVVKVRPVTAKQQRILDRGQVTASQRGVAAGAPQSKLAQVRREASMSRTSFMPAKSKAGSFGDAVAFVSGKKKASTAIKKRKHTTQNLGGDKRMRMPTAPSRQFTPAFRNPKL